MNPQHLNYNQNQTAFHQEKQKWENAISNYQGNDPLELWHNYICWYEQNIHLDQERLFETLLGKCLSIYETQQHYKQDTRFVKLWMKYIGLKSNPLQLYQVLYQRGIGTQCAIFYVGWAHYYDSANAFKQAESVYNLGFQANAEPYRDLERAHKEFRYSLSQRMLYNDQQSKKRSVSQLNDQRQQITSLNPSASPNVSNLQHAEGNFTPPPQPNQQEHVYAATQPNCPNQPPMQPYQNYSEPVDEQQPSAKKFRTTAPDEQRTYNRNTYNNFNAHTTQQVDYNRKPDTDYNDQYTQPKTNGDEINNSTSTACAIASSLNSVYSGDEDGSENYATYNYNGTSSTAQMATSNVETITYSAAPVTQNTETTSLPGGCVLPPNFWCYAKNHHDPWSWPIFLDEPDTHKICKYPRHLVYPGNGCEYSMEEIRARNYTKVIEIIKERNRQRDIASEQRRMNHMHHELENNQQTLHQPQIDERQRQAEIEMQRLAEIERDRQMKERESNRLAALEHQKAKEREEQQRRIAEQHKMQQMQQMQEQSAYAHQQQQVNCHGQSSPQTHPQAHVQLHGQSHANAQTHQQAYAQPHMQMHQQVHQSSHSQGHHHTHHQQHQPMHSHAPDHSQQPSHQHSHPVNNHSNYYDQNQSPAYNNYANYTAPSHQNPPTYQQMQPVQQPYYNQSHMAPQAPIHYQPAVMNNQNNMYQTQQQSCYPNQAMPPQHHSNVVSAAPPMPQVAPVHMQYQESSYQLHYTTHPQTNHTDYHYQMQTSSSAAPVNPAYAQPQSTELMVTETKSVNSFADDIEEQIEASTIVLKNGSDKLRKITIKYRKEKLEGEDTPLAASKTKQKKPKKPKTGNNKSRSTVDNLECESEDSTFLNTDTGDQFNESNDSFSTPIQTIKSVKSRKSRAKTKFDPSYLQDDESLSNSEFTTLYGKYSNGATDGAVNETTGKVRFNFAGATSTPIRNNNIYQSPCSSAKPSYKSNESSSKSSTPRNTYKSLRRRTSNISLVNSVLNDNDDSMTSFSMVEPNSFFEAESNDELNQQRLDKALKTIDTHFKKDHIDPFSSELCKAFLTKANFPSREHNAFYKLSNTLLSKLSNTKSVTIGDIRFNVEKEIGRGAYGSVYRGVNANTSDVVALKFQKPPNTWELYICFEVHQRIKDPDMLLGFMDISSAIIAPNASIFVSEFSQFGSLLDINNRIRQSTTKVMHESLVMHFTSQILNIVHYLHSCEIIHGDIKPDNFLLMKVPTPNSEVPTLRLIDFGCAIDMKFYKPNTQFKKVIQTDGFTCPEMLEDRQWSYQTDIFCVAGTVHVMLFGEYMQMVKKFGQYEIKQKLPRYLKKHIWTDFFSAFLNIKDAKNLPNLLKIKEKIDNELDSMESELQSQIRTLSNILYKR